MNMKLPTYYMWHLVCYVWLLALLQSKLEVAAECLTPVTIAKFTTGRFLIRGASSAIDFLKQTSLWN